MNQIIHGDCLEVMRAMPADSVSLTVCSPPYEAARTYGIDFKLRGQEYVDWAVERFVECVRVTSGLVCWVIEGQTRDFRYSAAPVLLMADLHRRGVGLRKPPIFRRIGIPGSGGEEWLRNDYEFCICATKGKLPWADNTAMGHPPKWAPGGEMSYRQSDGSRLNQWGHPIDSGATVVDEDGSVRSEGKRPSHVVVNGRDQWGGTPHETGGEGRKADGKSKGKHKFMSMTSRGANGKRKIAGGRSFSEKVEAGAKVHTKHDTEAEMREQAYLPPVLANPGNVIQEKYTAQQVAEMMGETTDVIDCLVGGGVMGDVRCHENEAPFPESLAEFFIRSFCHPGGTVLDPFCGSGTTLAVAKQTGRNYIGIDVRESQVKLSKRRVAEVQRELVH